MTNLYLRSAICFVVIVLKRDLLIKRFVFNFEIVLKFFFYMNKIFQQSIVLGWYQAAR